jgi:hypothetical protein
MRGSVSASEAEEELDFLRPSFLPGAAEEDERRERGRFIYLLVSVSLVVADYQLLFRFSGAQQSFRPCRFGIAPGFKAGTGSSH